jgi:hypothetical protein
VIGPDGVARQQTRLYQQTVLRVQAPPREGETVYARIGRVGEAGLVGVAVGGLVLAGLLWGRRRAVVGRPGPPAPLREERPVGRGPRTAPNEPTIPVPGDRSPAGGGRS